jgi:hypothetical protein
MSEERVNLYQWREEANRAVLEQKECPSCRSTERNSAGPCNDSWHYYVPQGEKQ